MLTSITTMEQIYINLDRLKISTVNVKGTPVRAFVVDSLDEYHRYVTVVADPEDEMIRENERVSIRTNKHGIRYIKRLPEIDEGNSVLMGYLVRFSLEANAFLVMNESQTCRLASGFGRDLKDKCLAAIPFETLVAAIPKSITEEKQPTFFYFSERFNGSVMTFGCMKELERAMYNDQIVMSKGNRYVLSATKRITHRILNPSSHENVPIQDRHHLSTAIGHRRENIR